MSVEHMAVVLHHSRAKGTAKLVLLGIANHMGDGGAWPSVTTLATYANVSERNVQKALTQLATSGELRVHVQAGGTRETPDHTRPNRYDVLTSCPPWCDRTPNHRDTRKLAGPQRRLWIKGVSDSTPGVASDRGGVSDATPGGVSDATPEPSLEPGPTTGSSSTTGHAREVRPPTSWRPCAVCSLPQLDCERRQVKLHAEDQHQYVASSPPTEAGL